MKYCAKASFFSPSGKIWSNPLPAILFSSLVHYAPLSVRGRFAARARDQAERSSAIFFSRVIVLMALGHPA